MTLTRRDRAAMVLALECLRNYTHPLDARDAIQDAHAALGLPNFGNDGARVTLDLALAATLRGAWVWDGRASRLLRARLALLLRVMLRVDAGDDGPRERIDEWFRDDRGPRLEAEGWARTWGGWEKRTPIRPLWEIAAREAGR
jgi:hypothetical protein